MKGVYFLPNLSCLKNWLSRSSFKDITVIFKEKLSTKEQRITKHAPVNTSLKESLNPTNEHLTIENYPAPYRFYIRARKGQLLNIIILHHFEHYSQYQLFDEVHEL